MPNNTDHEAEQPGDAAARVEQGDAAHEYPNIEACGQGCTSGNSSEWPDLREECRKVLAEVQRLRRERDEAREEPRIGSASDNDSFGPPKTHEQRLNEAGKNFAEYQKRKANEAQPAGDASRQVGVSAFEYGRAVDEITRKLAAAEASRNRYVTECRQIIEVLQGAGVPVPEIVMGVSGLVNRWKELETFRAAVMKAAHDHEGAKLHSAVMAAVDRLLKAEKQLGVAAE